MYLTARRIFFISNQLARSSLARLNGGRSSMTMHPYITGRYAEERRRDWIAQAEADRLARAARPRPRRRPARGWLRRGWRLVARPRTAEESPGPAIPAQERITEPDRELVR